MSEEDDHSVHISGLNLRVTGWQINDHNCVVLHAIGDNGKVVEVEDHRTGTLFKAVELFQSAAIGCHEGCCLDLREVLKKPAKVLKLVTPPRWCLVLFDPRDTPEVHMLPNRAFSSPQILLQRQWNGLGVLTS